MCFSFEVSITTFIISWSIAFHLLNKNLTLKHRKNVIMLMIFSSMQIVDVILWYIKMEKNNINYLVTSFLLPFILSLQLYYNVFVRNKNSNKFMKALTIIGCIYLFIRFNGYSVSLCDNKLSSPIWSSNEIKVWEFILFAIFILYPNWKLILLIIFILLPILHIFVGGSYGSMWCAIANIIALYYLYKY